VPESAFAKEAQINNLMLENPPELDIILEKTAP
jgi:hypothetical protein